MLRCAGGGGLPSGAGILLRFGQPAVILFFLLSGFVIFANERHRAIRPRGYFLRRLRRIYPPVLVAFVLSAVVVFDNGDLRAQFSWRELFFNLLMLQDVGETKPGVIAYSFLGNGPLWTLSYEAAFYLLFPFALAAWRRKPLLTTHLVGLICALSFACYIAQPNHFTLVTSYFQIWWCGAMIAAAYGEGKRSWLAVKVPLSWLAVLVAEAVWVSSTQPYDGVDSYPVLMLQHFALALIMIVGAFGPIGKTLARVLEPLARYWAGVASVSFGMYLFHYPLLVTWKRVDNSVGLFLAALLLIVMAWLGDAKLAKILPRAPRD